MPCLLSRKPVSIAALLTFGAGLAFSGVFSVWLASAEADRRMKALMQAADLRQTAFQEEFNEAIDDLTIISKLFSATGSHTQFQELARQLMERNPYIQAFSFVHAAPRTQHGRPQYRVTDFVTTGASNADVFVPDIGSLPQYERALAHARATGLPSATGLFDPAAGTGAQRAFAVFMPVYRKHANVQDGAHWNNAMKGYTAVVFRATPLVEHVLNRAALLRSPDTDISIHLDNEGRRELVYRSGAETPDRRREWIGWLVPETGGSERSVQVAGMRWHIVAMPSGAATAHAPASAWIALAMGIVVSALLALYLQSLAVRAAYLARANARLQEDIAARKHIEAALRESEERFHRLTNISSDWYWEQDANFCFTFFSAESIFGTPTRELLGRVRAELPLVQDDGVFAEYLDVVKAHKPFSDVECQVRTETGATHWVSISGEPVFGSGNEFLGYRGTGKDITDRKRAEEALRHSQTELRELAAHQARVREDERKRIAREIHDDLGQSLLALRIDVSLLEEPARRSRPVLGERVRMLLGHVDGVMRSVRAIINDLRPPVLDLGLRAAIEWQVAQFRQRSGVSCSLVIEGGDLDRMLDEEAATSVFRIVQESLTNVSRHAGASQVDIRLQFAHDMLAVSIADNGVGAPPAKRNKPSSFGLIGIRERVYSLGGEFHVDSITGTGTTLSFSIPASHLAAAA
ncbi:PAS domain S-box protein [Herbaspirillum sp. HC18]|nr:PAS domain S-box protein [Herbaspirillum sp. HC18]